MIRKLQVLAVHPLVGSQVVQVLLENRYALARPPILNLETLPQHVSPRLFIVDTCSLPTELSKLLRILRVRSQEARFLVLVPKQNYQDTEILSLLYLGVDGVLAFSDKFHAELPTAVEAVLTGGVWAPPHLVRKYQFQVSSFRSKETRSKFCLTGRENQVFGLLVRRFSNREIAEVLRITERTVKFHVSNILLKVEVNGRPELINWLFRRLARAAG